MGPGPLRRCGRRKQSIRSSDRNGDRLWNGCSIYSGASHITRLPCFIVIVLQKTCDMRRYHIDLQIYKTTRSYFSDMHMSVSIFPPFVLIVFSLLLSLDSYPSLVLSPFYFSVLLVTGRQRVTLRIRYLCRDFRLGVL
ncbi:hypothetical protein BDV38DRAFT_140703 [Aspergillus pseudotamarii]|uniref:Uncharacterized protein n=1 Tax=Aspergillus pseudotamarii TaxID=132259 RepID=A0A5N6SLA6_ASPPS|nr:uncharacterized protein BDV38DRAFT_140703 [Aspergillus pseudotamarii]KAE8135325.1 hypothetical protein BDV38DRAFT_140703 [Aspergillus pseudotamarii]